MPQSEGAELPFEDVDKGEWYVDYVAKVYANGIVNGVDTADFGIGQTISRQDMCVMIYRAAKAAGMEFNGTDPGRFADNEEIADYAKGAVYALKELGEVNGGSDTEFDALGGATRA